MDKRKLTSVFEAAVETWPENCAVTAPDATLTYRELENRANIIANYCIANGIGRGNIAALAIPNSATYIAAMLGVMKAGAVFMPVDTDAPRDRQERIFKNVRPDIIFTDDDHRAAMKQFLDDARIAEPLIVVTAQEESPERHPEGNAESDNPAIDGSRPDVELDPDDDLYIMFTSGTTGTPKAILGCRKSLAHFIHWEKTEFALNESLRVSNLAPTTFDVSLRDIFTPLSCGGMVSVPAEEVKSSPGALLDWIIDQKLTLIHIVPSMFRLFLEELEKRPDSQGALSALKYVMLAGEAVYGRDVVRFREIAGNGTHLVNLYGPSETTLAKLFCRLDFQPDNPGQIMPLGSPISNTAVIILKNNRLAEIGEIGEICIKTPFRSKGYFRDAEKTAESFVANPLSDDPGDIIYHSGDMGRYRTDRSVEFAGRLDRQVKVNGVRIELSEVDEAINSLPGIKEAHVMPYIPGDTGETRLICYYTESRPLETAAIREHIATRLYSSMIPSYFVRMDSFPLGINGKINRRALPKPDEIIYENTDYTPPESETEKRIAAIWSDILGIKKISVTIPFSLLGGGSMQAIRCVGNIARECGVNIRLHEFIEASTVRALASLVESREIDRHRDTIPHRPERPDYPATNSQIRLWTLQSMLPGFTAYNISTAFRVLGELNTDALEQAIATVIDRHEILRTVFFERNGILRQRVLPVSVFHLERAGRMESDEIRAEYADRFFQTNFDLEKGPLLRITVIDVGTETLLLLAMHHIIGDAWSLDLILNETLAAYHDITSDSTAAPPVGPRLQYRDFAAWQNERIESGAFDDQRDYWRTALSGVLPRIDLPLDAPRPSRKSYQGATFYHNFPAALLEEKQRYSQTSGNSSFVLLISSLRALLYRITGQKEIVLNTPLTLRERSELELMPGDFTNTVLLRATLGDTMSFADLANLTNDELGKAIANRDYPFDLIAPELTADNDLSRAPFSDVGITLVEDLEQNNMPVTGLEFEPFGIESGISKYDMVFHFAISGETLSLTIEYDAAIFNENRIRRMTDSFETLLNHALAAPDTPIAELAILSPAEQALIQRHEFPRKRGYDDSIIHGEFRRIVSETPGEPALVLPDSSVLSFSDVDRVSNHVAAMLLDSGIKAGDTVAVFMPRSFRVPIAILGILKTGAIYVPIARELPAHRIAYILDDSGTEIVLVDGEPTDALPGDIKAIDISAAEHHSDTVPPAPVGPEDGAYIIYTSGSTGTPKGVLLPHLGLVNRARDIGERFNISSNDRFTQFASLSFDASMYEMFCSLLNGASLVIVTPETIEDVDHFCSFITSRRVTFTLLPPSYLHSLDRRLLPGLRVIKTAGEPANVDDARFYAREYIYMNGYGPTEDSICCSIFTVDPDREYPFGIPIGDPIGDTEILVLDRNLKRLPIGVPGQLAVSDRGLALRYLNKPELTERVFLPHPFEPDKRLYLTGDLARWEEDGNLLFLGRLDNQVKINGHRIELEELEHVLRTIDGVDEAAVITFGEAGSLRLAAFYTGKAETPTVGNALKPILPRYMLPHIIKRLDSMPLTVSGKIDRASLPDPIETDSRRIVKAVSEEERVLIDICTGLLGVTALSTDAHFFATGGDSIRAIQAVARLREKDWSLAVADFFENPVISDLAGVMRRFSASDTHGDAIGTVTPTPILRWFRETVDAHPEHFNQSVLLRSTSPLDRESLDRALKLIWRHHDALRMTADDNAFVIRNTDTPFSLEYIDLAGNTDWQHSLTKHATEVQAGFDLSAGPLLKALLFRTPDGDRLLLVAHHLVVDAVSWHIIARDLEETYTMFMAGQSPDLPSKSTGFRNWAANFAGLVSSGTFDAELTYWRNIVSADCDTFAPREQTASMQTLTATITGENADSIAGNGDGREIQARMLAGLGAALAHWKNMTRIRILLEGHGRTIDAADMDVSRTVGWFTAAWPFLLNCGENIDGMFKETHDALKDVPNDGIGYGALRYCAGHEELAATPELSFNYLGHIELEPGAFAIADEDCGDTVSPENNFGHALELLLSVENGALNIHLSFDTGRIDISEAETFLSLYKNSLIDAAACQATEYDFNDFGEGGLDSFLENM